MKIYLIRHGETDWNVQQKYQGHLDIELNEQGREHARIIADYLKDKNIMAIYSSDLARARETADIIAKKTNLEVITDSRLREMSFGDWEGKTFSEIYRDYKEQFEEWLANSIDYVIPGGESLGQLTARVWPVINDISQKHNGEVALVTHGGVIRAILYRLQIIDHEGLWNKNILPGSVALLDIEKKDYQFINL